MSLLAQCVPMALVGLKHVDGKKVAMPLALSDLCAATPLPEQQFLQQVGLLSLYEQAGVNFAISPHTWAEVDLPENPLSSATKASICVWFETASQQKVPQLLVEGLLAMRQHGIPLPDQLWPLLFDYADKYDLPAYWRPLLNSHAVWLAQQHLKWQTLLPVTLDSLPSEAVDLNAVMQHEVWQLGSAEARLAYFGLLRMRSPHLAAELLQADDAQIKASEKVNLILALEQEISMADEPYLMRQLAARSGQVRQAAQQMLSLLPHSEYVLSLQKAVFDRIQINPQSSGFFAKIKEKLSSHKLELDWPEDINKLGLDLKKYGLEADEKQAKAEGFSVQEYVLKQCVSVIPFSAWQIHLNAEARDIFSQGLNSIWSKGLTAAWAMQAEIAPANATQIAWSKLLLAERENKKASLFNAKNMIAKLPIIERIAYLWDFDHTPAKNVYFFQMTALVAQLPLDFQLNAQQTEQLLQSLIQNLNPDTLRYMTTDWVNIVLFCDMPTLIKHKVKLEATIEPSQHRWVEQFLLLLKLRTEINQWLSLAQTDIKKHQ